MLTVTRVLAAAAAVHIATVVAFVLALVLDAPTRVTLGLAAAVVFTVLWVGVVGAERARQAEERRRAADPPDGRRPALRAAAS